jgi:glycosyltransferase involved in cell wall biosynthesis
MTIVPLASAVDQRMNESPIPVMQFCNTSVRAGAEEHILTLLRGLDRKYFRLHLVCSPDVADALRLDLPPDVELLPLFYPAPSHVAAAARLGRWIRERHIQILHSHLFTSSLCSSPVGWMCCVPFIVETPHVRESWRRGWKANNFTVDRIAGRFVDRYIAVSYANARYLIEEKGLPEKKVRVIQNGTDLSRFNPAHVPPPGLRAELAIGAVDPVMLVAARLEPQKGHSVLLNAIPEVLREFPNARLLCLGDGVLRDELERQSKQLGLQENLRFLGFRSNVTDWLALCDFTVLPSFYEGLPLVAVESLAAGRAMVATAVDGTPEVIVNGRTGITVPPGDPWALAAAICSMLRSPVLRQRMAEQGRAYVLERFSQERQVRETGEFYLQALGRTTSSVHSHEAQQAVAS